MQGLAATFIYVFSFPLQRRVSARPRPILGRLPYCFCLLFLFFLDENFMPFVCEHTSDPEKLQREPTAFCSRKRFLTYAFLETDDILGHGDLPKTSFSQLIIMFLINLVIEKRPLSYSWPTPKSCRCVWFQFVLCFFLLLSRD